MNTLKVIENWIIENSTVLDLGCGDGAMLERLKIKKSIRGYHETKGIDLWSNRFCR